jgi:Helix-turn-helix domain
MKPRPVAQIPAGDAVRVYVVLSWDCREAADDNVLANVIAAVRAAMANGDSPRQVKADDPPIAASDVMTSRDLATYLNIKTSTLAGWRVNGRGPRFSKAGASVRYRRGDVEEWLGSQSRRFTQQTVR